MHATRSKLPVVASGILGLAAVMTHAACRSGEEARFLPAASSEEPDARFDSYLKPREVSWEWNGHQHGAVSYFTFDRTVAVSWAAPFEDGHVEQSAEYLEYPVSFFPTDVDLVDAETLIVAGKARGTHTLLEVWSFSWPAQWTLPYYDSAGTRIYDLTVPTLVTVDRVIDEDVPGRRLVLFSLGLQGSGSGSAAHALVQFDDSRDLYDVDLSGGGMVLVAGPGQAGAMAAVPELGDGHQFAWKADHADFGYVYVFGFDDNGDPGDPPTLVFKDTDRDGDVDAHELVLPGAWQGSAWDDESKYVR